MSWKTDQITCCFTEVMTTLTETAVPVAQSITW